MTTYGQLELGAEFVDTTYGALWQKTTAGALCLCGAGQNKEGEVKTFSSHFKVETA